METLQKQKSLMQDTLMSYPVMKNFSEAEIILNPEEKTIALKPVGKTIFGLATLGALVGGGYLVWTYILPPVMIMLGQFLALAATGLAAVFLVMMLPVILKAFKRFARASEQALIREDPFGELESQKQKMMNQRVKFKEAKIKINSLRSTMQSESNTSASEASKYQDRIVTLRAQCTKLKATIDKIIAEKGPGAKETDEVAELEIELTKKLSEAQRSEYQMNQSSGLVQKYGTKAAVMGKLDRNLSKAQTAMDIKIQDFEVTIDMLKKDYAFAKTAKDATDAVKDAMGFTKEWQLEYAMDVVTSTISMDIARTSENLLDIETLTSQYSVDNDELFNRLDVLATKIVGGQEAIPQSTQYSNPNYKLTQDDKKSASGFEGLF